MSESGERKLAAIMFTDIVGYSALTQTDEALALTILKRHNQLLRPFFSRYRGREVNTAGDSFLIEFDSALDATLCAVEIQKFLHDYNISAQDEWRIRLRIGIHLGDVIREGNNILGDAVNIASRVEPLADPEGVCVSEQVFDQVHNKIPYPFERLESPKLKNITFPTNVYFIVMPWLEKLSHIGAQQSSRFDSRRVAVLPFSSLSADSNDEYFADGMTEELISKISLINELSVISRTSVMNYKDPKVRRTIREIGTDLRVGTILEGSLRKAGNRIRVSAQLINVEADTHLWSANYDRTLDDVFGIQSEIADSVAEALRVRLLPSQKGQIRKAQTEDPEAHVSYLKGLVAQRKRTKEGLEKAINYFEQAIEKDPSYAQAYAALAHSLMDLGFTGIMPSKKAYGEAERMAEKALEIDPNLPEAHLALGNYYRRSEWDHRSAEKEYQKALELNPNLADAHLYVAVLKGQEGRTDEAMEETKRGVELDPVSADALSMAGMTCLYLRDYGKAIIYLSDAKEIDPNIWGAHNLGLALVQEGKVDKGIHIIESRNPTGAEEKMELAYAYTRAGRVEDAKEILADAMEKAKENSDWTAAVAGIYSSLGNKEEALSWLERAYDEHAGFLKAHLWADFIFDPLRSDDRFLAIMKKIGLAP